MSELKEIGGFIVSADPFVQHDSSLSGNGTVNSPLGVVPGAVGSQLVVSTVEDIGTYNVNSSNDTAFSHDFSKTGYTPISFTIMYGYAAWINANYENTSIENNTLKLRGYARTWSSSFTNVAFKALITWMKIS